MNDAPNYSACMNAKINVGSLLFSMNGGNIRLQYDAKGNVVCLLLRSEMNVRY